jgi:hypothetical protein
MSFVDSYSHSGKFGPATLPAGLVGGLAGGLVLTWLYQLFVDWIPLIYFNVIATLGLGFALGYMTGSLLRWAHCRNNLLAALVTAVVSLACVGVSFYFAYDRVVRGVASKHGGTVSELKEKLPIRKYLEIRVEKGWTIGRGGGLPVKGVFVYLIWLLELLIVVFCAVTTAKGVIEDPYCEDCQRWSEEEILGRRSSVTPEGVAQAVEKASIDDLIHLAPDPSGTSALAFKLHSCNECLQLAFLTVTREWAQANSKGELEQKSETVAAMVRVSQKQRDQLKEQLKGAVPAGPTEEPAT